MKTLTKTFITLFFMATISWPMITSSQEWSTEQQEVLAVTENIFEYWGERDLEGFMSFFHENFMGWFGTDPFPNDKETLRELESLNLENEKIHHYRFKPISVTVTDNVAIVNMYYIAIRENENGKIQIIQKRQKRILRKMGNG